MQLQAWDLIIGIAERGDFEEHETFRHRLERIHS